LDSAIRLATYFRNANNKFFIAKLHELQKNIYGGKHYAITAPEETR